MRKRILSVVLAIFFIVTMIGSNFSVYSAGKKVLDPIVDDTREHNALKWTVQGISTQASLQAFVIGWNIKFTAGGKTITVYVPRNMNYWGHDPVTNIFPLTDRWSSSSQPMKGIKDGNSIKDFATSKTLYEEIITNPNGCQIEANAKIQKYKYDSSKTGAAAYTATSPTVATNIASSYTELKNDFDEFTSDYITNAAQYFDIDFALPPEKPKEEYTNTIKIQYWEKTSIATIPRSDITQQNIVVTADKGTSTTAMFTPTANIPTDYIIVGNRLQYVSDMPTSSWTDYSTWNKILYFPLTVPNVVGYLNILIEKPLPPDPETGNIHITCRDYATNSEISSSLIQNVPYGIAKTVSAPTVDGYTAKGSYSSFSSSTPSQSKMIPNVLTQTVTLSSTNKDAYVCFWDDKKAEIIGPVAYIDGPTTVKAGNDFNLSGSRSYCKQAGATIVKYAWSVPITGVSGTTSFGSPGTYTVTLTVTDSNGLTGSTTHNIEATPPTPSASFSLSGKIKENRKITVDARDSDSPDNYPIDWSRTTWKIEPDTSTGATWEMGVRLSDGTVKIINQTTDQSILNGQSKLYFQARYAGNYKVKLIVTNTYPASDTYNGTIVVAKDIAPIAAFEEQKTALREYENPVDNTKRKYSKSITVDKSYSPDSDIVGKRTWGVRYNSNNNKDSSGNPIFTDTCDTTKYASELSSVFLPTEVYRLVAESDNDTTVELWSYDVGQYGWQLTVEESIPNEETIIELLLSTDYRSTTAREW